MLSKIKKVFDTIWSWTSTVSGVFLILNIAVIIANIVLRRFFNAPIYGSTELVRYCSLISASFALAQNEWFDGNVKMTLLHETIKKKVADVLRTIMDVACFIGFIFVSYALFGQIIQYLNNGAVTQDLSMPTWIFSLVLFVGFVFLTISFFWKSCIQISILAGKDIEMPKKPPEPGMEDIEKMDLQLQEEGV